VAALWPLDPHTAYPRALGPLGLPTGPSAAHPFGVDVYGHDVLAGVLRGLRNALWQAAAGSFAAVLLARALGRIRGLADLLAAVAEKLPPLLLGLLLSAAGLTGAPVIVLAAFVGALPGALAPARPGPVYSFLAGLPAGVLTAAALSFLGVEPGASTLGGELASAGLEIRVGVNDWWGLLFPGLTIALAALICDRAALALATAGPAVPARAIKPARRGRSAVIVLATLLAAALAVALAGGLAVRHPGPTLLLLAGGLVLSLPLLRLPGRLLAYFPASFLGLLGVWLLADDVGRFPLVPRTYGSLDALLIPWVVAAAALTGAAARLGSAPAPDGRIAARRRRWARATGLRRRVRMRRGVRSLIAAWPEVLAPGRLRALTGAVVTLEVIVQAPGARSAGNEALLIILVAVAGGVWQWREARA
jgi:ABC-type dipeptide/oligopeptide/nickel transport system permease subunit